MKHGVFVIFTLIAALVTSAWGHEVRPAYAEFVERETNRFDVRFKVPGRGDMRLALSLRVADSGRVDSPRVVREVAGAFVEEFRFDAGEAGIAGQTIEIDGLATTLTDALVRIVYLNGAEQIHRLTAATPYCVVEAAPTTGRVAWRYFELGVEHILLGIDHLLFVAALLLLVRGVRRIVATITAFTIAHSITLTGAALGWAAVPGPPVEAVIALSIVFVAGEIVKRARGEIGLAERRPWIVAFSFGLLHGFGFAGALSEIGLPGHAVPLALASFNCGVEFGQLLFVAVIYSVVVLVARLAPRIVSNTAALSRLSTAGAYAIGTIATFWFFQRIAGFAA
jgi:hydrogenase/urease accessory protein HupE